MAEVERQPTARSLPISIALGELPQFEAAAPALPSQGIRFAKIGLAGCRNEPDWPLRWARALDRLPAAVGRVAVVYADWQAAGAPQAGEILRAAGQLHCSAALVDTFDKRGGQLLDHWSPGQIEDFIGRARELGMLAVVGGGLNRANIPAVAALAPDYVAVRGAACQGQRCGGLSRQRVERLVELVRRPVASWARN